MDTRPETGKRVRVRVTVRGGRGKRVERAEKNRIGLV